MVEALVGGSTAEKILLYLVALGEGYPAEIARACLMSNTQTQRSMERLEQAGIIVARPIGRARVYQLNQQWFLAKELKALLDKALLYMPLEDQARYFGARKKPRKKNKPIRTQ